LLLAVVLTTAALMRIGGVLFDMSVSDGRGAGRFIGFAQASIGTPLLGVVAALLLTSRYTQSADRPVRSVQLVIVIACGVVTAAGAIAYQITASVHGDPGFLTLQISAVATVVLVAAASIVAATRELLTRPSYPWEEAA
jgi:hypothetical protein